MGEQDSIDKYIKTYRDRIDFLEEAYKDEKYRKFLDERLKQKHPGYTDFAQWLRCIENQYAENLKERDKKYFTRNYFLHFDKCDITMFYNDIKELQGGKKTYSRKVYDSIKNWDKPYLKKVIGVPVDRDNDFYSLDVSYYFRSTIKVEEARKLISSSRREFKQDSLESAYWRLQGSKVHKNISIEYLQIKKMLYRSHFKELIVTVGLKDSILKIKDDIQEINNR